MAAFTPEDLGRLREAVRLRGEQIERRKREIDVLRRAAWLRMDLLHEDGALDPPGVPLYPAAAAREECPGAAAGEPAWPAPATTETAMCDAAPELAANGELAPTR